MNPLNPNISSNFITLFLIVAFMLLGMGCSSQSKKEITTHELTKITSFPDTSANIFLDNPINMAFSDSHLFISDQMASTVFQFRHSGKYQRRIGGEGGGPREFNLNREAHFKNGKLFINDMGNSRISILNTATNQMETYLIKIPPSYFAVSQTKLFSVKSIRPEDVQHLDSLKLVELYDHKANHLKSFGSYLDFVEDMKPDGSSCQLSIYNNELYVHFTAYPILRKYSLTGEQQDSLNLNQPPLNYKDRIAINYTAEAYEEGERNLKTLFETFEVNKSGIFNVLWDDQYIIIDHFNHEGNFIRRYKRKTSSDKYYIDDLKVFPKSNGNLKFYILNLEDDFPKVDVFSWESS